MSLTSRPAAVSLRGCARTRRIVVALLAAAVILASGTPATAADTAAHYEQATSPLFLQTGGSGHAQGPVTGAVNLNQLIGAQRFYDAGFTGTNAVMANIEAGHVWNGHETLAHTTLIPTSGSALGQFDRHATWVASVMGGRPGGANSGDYQRGIAPDAQLASGAIATGWSGTRYSLGFFLNIFSLSTYGPYRAAFIDGVPVAGGTRTADVINSSWMLGSGTHGSDELSGVLDALANYNPHTLLVFAAGNFGPGPNQVNSPASAFNNLTVAALRPNGGAYDLPSTFSSGGPNDYFDPVRGFVTAARQAIDIAAPGENFAVAYYGGQTGGNGPTLSGPANGPAGGPNWYSLNVNGTSFAAPTVAGAAALLYDAAHTVFAANPHARDARVMKAVLMNSADKTLGWNNGQLPHPNGHGGVLTTQGLDNRVGTGRLNLDRAFDQFLGGTTDVPGTAQGFLGTVDAIGWDFGLVTPGITNDYLIGPSLLAESPFTATLTWFRDRSPFGTTGFRDDSYNNLDLELWRVIGGSATTLISASASIYNNSEHFHFDIPTTGQYMLRVRWTDELFHRAGILNNSELYALAWHALAVPEPTSVLLLLTSLVALSFVRRRTFAI